MSLKTSLTGSFPPEYNPNVATIRYLPEHEQEDIVRRSTERAVRDQIALGLDFLVDGQVRDDITSIFCTGIPGFSGNNLPYRVTGRIRPSEQSITVSDYLIAKELAGGRPLKAHLTGPMTIAKEAVIDSQSGYSGRDDPKLIHDIAHALGQEARFLVEAGAEIVQIDEPVLADGIDLDIAFDAMRRIIELGQIPFPALHACGNVCNILDAVLTRSPVRMVSLEGSWLRYDELAHIDRGYLARCGKQIGLGCISVADYTVERHRSVESFLDQMVIRLGADNIWAIMPNCGFRLMPYEKAIEKIEVMVKAAHSLRI
jgi:5-methyltetrahydropteroyltriglutamate--homocysteine methyltransferase